MQSWLAKKLLDHNLARLRAGDYRPLLRFDHPDIRFRFPGDSSWAVDLQGRDELERWLQRLVDTGMQLYADEAVLVGPPWNATICLRGTDHLDRDGKRVYDNRFVIWGRMKWGRLYEYEVYEDTQASKALDEHLSAA
ncbi:MAG TPA: hypothetical protein VHX88_11305 [Solirubrobacteraceae bacterium]|jgi:ketosteroid isomerase-like protein|nr:hypothetical protein [Solirubrobacteraceae bacterium]